MVGPLSHPPLNGPAIKKITFFGFPKLLQQNYIFLQVEDLTVPEERLSAAKQEAETLMSLEISELNLQWLQVCKRAPPPPHSP